MNIKTGSRMTIILEDVIITTTVVGVRMRPTQQASDDTAVGAVVVALVDVVDDHKPVLPRGHPTQPNQQISDDGITINAVTDSGKVIQR